MSRKVNKRDLSPILSAARTWIDRCLVADGSIFSEQQLWTPELVRELRDAFDGHPDAGEDRFIVKLRRQMTACSPSGQQLMGEILWALLLFPSSVAEKTKLSQIQQIWELSGADLPSDVGVLSDAVLAGIGSGGIAYNTKRPNELTFLLGVATDLKEMSTTERRKVFDDYPAFLDWIDTVPQFGHRQFRHMLRYFAFPDLVERMSSNADRRAVLDAYDVANHASTKRWSDRQLDEALLDLRRKLEREHPGQVLDFYEQPLRQRWKRPDDEGETSDSADVEPVLTSDPVTSNRPTNLILYGPPGTGKTHWLRTRFADYTDWPDQVDESTWLQGLVSGASWRSVIAAALDQLGGASRVPDLRKHVWIEELARNRGRSAHVNHTIWATLQSHTPASVEHVKYANRREPYLFSKDKSGVWRLLPDWRDNDEEAAELALALQAGRQGEHRPVKRYRVITFHPSFSYEDFVRGIRPVATASDDVTQFRNVDGVFKRLCDEARANPKKRYALFIDEINRANIAKVFGELITLIEVDKRARYDEMGGLTEGMEVALPGSQDAEVPDPPFSVPANLDIYGTMNTADRSIALLDIALRRRFEFKEMPPDYEVLDRMVEGVHLGRLLSQVNDRVEFLLDRDHRIGHAYLMRVTDLDELRGVFARHVIPLLQEFFFDDFSKIALVLQTSAVDAPLLNEQRLGYSAIFNITAPAGIPTEKTRYHLSPPLSWTAATFKGIYDPRVASDEPSA